MERLRNSLSGRCDEIPWGQRAGFLESLPIMKGSSRWKVNRSGMREDRTRALRLPRPRQTGAEWDLKLLHDKRTPITPDQTSRN